MTQDAQLQLALAHFNAGRYAEAEPLLQQLVQQTPGLLTAQLYLAQLAVLSGQGAQWITRLEAWLQQHPYLADGYHVLGQCYQQNRQLPQAAHAFHHALTLLYLNCVDHGTLVVSPTTTTLSEFEPQRAQVLLWQTLAMLKQKGLYAFATAGTLLGLERSGALLPHDKDMDIGVDWLQMSDAIAALEAHGWREFSRSYDLINPRCFKHHATGIVIDLCGYGTDTHTGATISGLWMDKIPFEWNRVTFFPAISLRPHPSPAGEVWHLRDPDSLLTALYGPDWRRPDPLFDTIVCAHNLRQFSWLSYCYAYARLYGQWSHGHYDKALRLLETLRQHSPNDTILKSIQTYLSANARTPKRALALGYFDLLHQGHLNYLNFARQQGDTLIVGVAPDHFCQNSKGYSPVMSQQSRLDIVSALAMVDEAHLVGAPMAQTQAAADWIKQHHINIVVCGEEWQGSERWQALTHRLNQDGIEVVFAPRTEGISTTQIKQKIAQQPTHVIRHNTSRLDD